MLENCPKCNESYTYEDNGMLVCPMCFHEWKPGSNEEEEEKKYYDVNGNELKNGDTVTLTKGLKVKGAPKDLKAGQKVKNIRLVDGDHDIECKIEGFGNMMLKSEFVKKV